MLIQFLLKARTNGLYNFGVVDSRFLCLLMVYNNAIYVMFSQHKLAHGTKTVNDHTVWGHGRHYDNMYLLF